MQHRTNRTDVQFYYILMASSLRERRKKTRVVGESKMVSSEVGTAIDMLEILIVNYHEID